MTEDEAKHALDESDLAEVGGGRIRKPQRKKRSDWLVSDTPDTTQPGLEDLLGTKSNLNAPTIEDAE